MLQTRVLVPLLYDAEKIADEDLRDAVTDVFGETGATCEALYTIETGEQTTKLNAMVGGFGPGKRVYLFDTLVAELTVPELRTVLAHELGHWKRRHLWKKVGALLATAAVLLFVLSVLTSTGWLYGMFDLPRETYVGLLTGWLWIYPFQRLSAPLNNWLSYRHEHEADASALESTGELEATVDALRKLSDENLTNPFPHPWYAAFEQTHPPVPERIRHLREHVEGDSSGSTRVPGRDQTQPGSDD